MYRFIYDGYNLDFWFWEVLILFRKIFMMAAAVFLREKVIMIQGLAVLTILFVATSLQLYNKPYRDSFLNKVEASALVVSTITMLLPLYAYFATGIRLYFSVCLCIYYCYFSNNIYAS